jgi:DNA adenine methylase
MSDKIRQKMIQSPLRYPGGKRRLSPYIAEILRTHQLRPKLFVEPFAGGASVSIAMLEHDLVETIALADLDDLVATFWRVVFSAQGPQLADACLDVVADLPTWRRFKTGTYSGELNRALQCLFLNRTSFSGILNRRAGPLGGWSQATRLLDCRFPRERLADRILELSRLRERVLFVRAQSWRKTLADVSRMRLARQEEGGGVFWYLDPPFFQKAHRLYRHFFEPHCHVELAAAVRKLPGNWLVSYDAAEAVRALYRDRDMHLLHMVYTARRQDGRAISGREILVSDLQLPGLEAAAGRSRRISLAIMDGDGAATQAGKSVNFPNPAAVWPTRKAGG